jgi:hypothetical protein
MQGEVMAKETWYDLTGWLRQSGGASGVYIESLERALDVVPYWFANGHIKVQITECETHKVVALFVLEDGNIVRLI